MNYKYNPLVSIVIPVYNGANYLREAIDSALAQTYPNIEIIVVNDGSTDNTREIALSYGDKIRYFEKENGGVSTALNLAIKNMRGEYFSWLSHDDVYEPDKVQLQIEGLNVCGISSAIIAVYCDYGRIIVANNERQIREVPKKFKETGIYFGIEVFMYVGLFGCELLIPKNYFSKYGLFDECFCYTQDTIKWFQMFQENDLLHVSGLGVWERVHSCNKRNETEGYYRDRILFWKYVVDNITAYSLERLKYSLYEFCSYLLIRNKIQSKEYEFFYKKLLSLSEPLDVHTKINIFLVKLMQDTSKSIYLYCAGQIGKRLSMHFNLCDINIAGFSDSDSDLWGKTIDGHLCVPLENIPLDSFIIVAKLNPREIQKTLNKLGYMFVTTYDDICDELNRLPVLKSKMLEYQKSYCH